MYCVLDINQEVCLVSTWLNAAVPELWSETSMTDERVEWHSFPQFSLPSELLAFPFCNYTMNSV
jgi:hypothetical protein